MGAAETVIDVTTTTFQAAVVERSRTTPVLIDFWATWCGPCKTLSPVLENLAREMNGRFVLAKVDIDANPELADVFRIQNVPSVMLLKEGRIADGFTGALPEAQVRKFLEPHLGAPVLDAMTQAAQFEQEGDRAGAAAILRDYLQQKPNDAKARTMLARLLVAEGRIEEARKVFGKLTGAELETDGAKAIAARLDAASKLGDLSKLEAAVAADPANVAAQLALGQALVAASQYDKGLEHLLQAAKLDVHHDGDAPRKALIEVFNVLGQADPRTLEYQRSLMMILCV